MLTFLEPIRELNVLSVVIRFALATFFGGIIGMERGRKRRPAGFRTHMLVCIGSALAMMTNEYVTTFLMQSGDPSRLGAQVISGIGFLGAGTIIVTGKQQVKGLTTAAGLWASACMGLAIGIGFYEGAILGGCSIILIIVALHSLDNRMYSRSKVIDLFVELKDIDGIRRVMEFLKIRDIKISSFEITERNVINKDCVGVIMTIASEKYFDHNELISEIGLMKAVKYVEEIS